MIHNVPGVGCTKTVHPALQASAPLNTRSCAAHARGDCSMCFPPLAHVARPQSVIASLRLGGLAGAQSTRVSHTTRDRARARGFEGPLRVGPEVVYPTHSLAGADDSAVWCRAAPVPAGGQCMEVLLVAAKTICQAPQGAKGYRRPLLGPQQPPVQVT